MNARGCVAGRVAERNTPTMNGKVNHDRKRRHREKRHAAACP